MRKVLPSERDTAWDELAALKALHDQLTINVPHDRVLVDMVDDLHSGRVLGTNAPFFTVKAKGVARLVVLAPE